MCSQDEVYLIVHKLRDSLCRLFPQEQLEAILFGSYARNDADEGSDIDVLFLVDVPRHTIAERNWEVGEAAADLLLEHGVVVSPIVENRAYFHRQANVLPFFKNIQREGVRMSA